MYMKINCVFRFAAEAGVIKWLWNKYTVNIATYSLTTMPSGFGGLEVACWPLAPKFAGSNPAKAVGFFRAKKSSAPFPSEGK